MDKVKLYNLLGVGFHTKGWPCYMAQKFGLVFRLGFGLGFRFMGWVDPVRSRVASVGAQTWKKVGNWGNFLELRSRSKRNHFQRVSSQTEAWEIKSKIIPSCSLAAVGLRRKKAQKLLDSAPENWGSSPKAFMCYFVRSRHAHKINIEP